MTTCPVCPQPATKRHGHDGAGRQRFLGERCRRRFTGTSGSAFSGDRWPPDEILMAVRWYLRRPLSGTSAMVFLAERGIDVSQRTGLRWVQTVGPRDDVRRPEPPAWNRPGPPQRLPDLLADNHRQRRELRPASFTPRRGVDPPGARR
jgi:transposase-like protein